MAFASNPKAWGRILVLAAVLAVLCATDIGGTAQVDGRREHVVMVGAEELRFAAQPELGYVLKVHENASSLDALSGMLKYDTAADVTPMGGVGRKSISIVHTERPADENQKTVKLLAAHKQVQYVAPLFSSNGQIIAIIPEIVVRVKPGTEAEQVQTLCKTAGCAVKKRMEFTEQEYLVEVLGPDADSVFAAVEIFSQSASVEWACPNTASQPKPCGQSVSLGGYTASPFHVQNAMVASGASGVFPNDEYFPRQWHLHNTGQSGGTPGVDVRAPEAWQITTGDPNIVVAVVDTGVDLDHPDLIDNLVPGHDFYQNDDIPEPSEAEAIPAHGTASAGLVAARGDNVIGVVGVTWHCGLMPIRAYMWGAWGATPQSEVATALRWAAAHGADVLSNSWVENIPLPIVRSALVDVTTPGGIGRDGKGCVVLFASGNESGRMLWPARYAEVIAVGATDKTDQILSYSSRGPELDLVAPSGTLSAPRANRGEIWTTDIVGPAGWGSRDPEMLDYTDSFSGTSAACPIAAGVAALILSIEPNLTSDEVRHFLQRSAKDLGDIGRDDTYGWGRVDARAALDMVLAKRADLNDDWKVDLEDLLILIEFWGMAEPSADIAPAARRDGIVNEQDLKLLMQYWQTEIPLMPEPGLLAHWKLDETEGNIAYESVSLRNGSLHGDPRWQPTEGVVAGALALDGLDDYVATEYVPGPPVEPFSVFAWIQGGAPGDVFISQTDGIGGSGETWLGTEPSSGKLMTGLVPPTAGRFIPQPLKSESVITDGQWHHIGFVWDGSYRSLYVDGAEVAKDAGALAPLKSATGGLYIGAGKILDATSFFSGLIDDVRIYDRAIKP